MIMYLRTSLTFLCQDELVRFEVRDGLEAILNVDLQHGAWTQALFACKWLGDNREKIPRFSRPSLHLFLPID